MTDRPLFDRPSRDPILITWLVLLGIIAALALNANTTWSGTLESDRVAGFLADFLAGAILSLMLLLVPAYIRWFWRYSHTLHLPRRRWWRPSFWGAVFEAYAREIRAGSSATPDDTARPVGVHDKRDWLPHEHGRRDHRSAAGNRPTVWPLNGGRLFKSARGGGSETALFGKDPRRSNLPAPRFSSIALDRDVAAPGVPTRITWHAENARSVSINGIHGFPASGSGQVQLHASGPVELRAMGAGGTATGLTSEVLYLALPEISKVTMPPGPGVSFETALQLRPDEDWVLDRQIHGILRSHDRATQRLMLDARTRPKPLVPEDVKQKLIRELMPTDRLRSAITEILIPRLRSGAADLHDQGRQNP